MLSPPAPSPSPCRPLEGDPIPSVYHEESTGERTREEQVSMQQKAARPKDPTRGVGVVVKLSYLIRHKVMLSRTEGL
jgi:hypothetical protein